MADSNKLLRWAYTLGEWLQLRYFARRIPLLLMTSAALAIMWLNRPQANGRHIDPFTFDPQYITLFLAIAIASFGFTQIMSDYVLLRHSRYYDHYSEHYSSSERRFLTRDSAATAKSTGQDQYMSLVSASRSLASSLYNRSGVYLISGVTLAIGGIVMFYLLRPTLPSGSSPTDIIIALLPGSSMLLLVELIAFFFLRQSRAVMDEFRHFDHLARNREELLVAMRLAEESGNPLDVTTLMANGFYFTRGDRFAPGESSDIVETRKLEKTEIDLLQKVVELIGHKPKA